MNTHEHNNNASRPLEYWLKTVDRLLAAEFATAFQSEGASRRTWRLLNAVDGTVAPRRPLDARRLRPLIERGWVTADGDGFTLTDEGSAAKERLAGLVASIRARVGEAVPEEQLATTLASLEKIAQAFGWSEDAPHPHFHKRGRHHRRHARGEHGAHDHDWRGHGRCGEHADHPHGRRGFGPRGEGLAEMARFGQHSYERGFDAGFARGRDA